MELSQVLQVVVDERYVDRWLGGQDLRGVDLLWLSGLFSRAERLLADRDEAFDSGTDEGHAFGIATCMAPGRLADGRRYQFTHVVLASNVDHRILEYALRRAYTREGVTAVAAAFYAGRAGSQAALGASLAADVASHAASDVVVAATPVMAPTPEPTSEQRHRGPGTAWIAATLAGTMMATVGGASMATLLLCGWAPRSPVTGTVSAHVNGPPVLEEQASRCRIDAWPRLELRVPALRLDLGTEQEPDTGGGTRAGTTERASRDGGVGQPPQREAGHAAE